MTENILCQFSEPAVLFWVLKVGTWIINSKWRWDLQLKVIKRSFKEKLLMQENPKRDVFSHSQKMCKMTTFSWVSSESNIFSWKVKHKNFVVRRVVSWSSVKQKYFSLSFVSSWEGKELLTEECVSMCKERAMQFLTLVWRKNNTSCYRETEKREREREMT